MNHFDIDRVLYFLEPRDEKLELKQFDKFDMDATKSIDLTDTDTQNLIQAGPVMYETLTSIYKVLHSITSALESKPLASVHKDNLLNTLHSIQASIIDTQLIAQSGIQSIAKKLRSEKPITRF